LQNEEFEQTKRGVERDKTWFKKYSNPWAKMAKNFQAWLVKTCLGLEQNFKGLESKNFDLKNKSPHIIS
jgi:hypothetical protein